MNLVSGRGGCRALARFATWRYKMPINAKPCPNCGARYFPEDKMCPTCGINIGQLAPKIADEISTPSLSVPFFIKVLRVFGGINLAVGLLIGFIILLVFSKSAGL